MNFGLTEEQEMLQEMLRGFVQNECPTTRLRELFDAGRGHDDGLWAALAEMGIAGLIVPEELGGAGMELLELALVSEILGEGGLPSPFIGHSLACLALSSKGSPEQQARLLPALASGERIGTVALHESATGWLPQDWTVELEDGRLQGTKTIVSHADLASGLLVGLQGGDLAWVDANAAGIRVEPVDGVDRTRPFATVHFDDVAAEALEAGTTSATRLIDAAAILLAADAFGAASKLVDLDVAYSLSREQFGRPIAEFQSIKHQIARLATDLEPTRALWWFAAHAFDHLPAEAARAASLAKAHISDRAIETARQSVELHGGYGFTWECEVQMWFKRIMFDRSFLGTPEDHRARCAELGGW
jgi:alkylation response protein AidB-like acyl-CoA dehydrogenase